MKAEVIKPALPRPVVERTGAVSAARAEPTQAPSKAAADVIARAEQAAAAAADANRRLAEKGSQLTIEFDDSLGRAIFKIVDATTGDVVRQIPSEQVLAIARALSRDESRGLLLRGDA